jgi:hypothetical protein
MWSNDVFKRVKSDGETSLAIAVSTCLCLSSVSWSTLYRSSATRQNIILLDMVRSAIRENKSVGTHCDKLVRAKRRLEAFCKNINMHLGRERSSLTYSRMEKVVLKTYQHLYVFSKHMTTYLISALRIHGVDGNRGLQTVVRHHGIRVKIQKDHLLFDRRQ